MKNCFSVENISKIENATKKVKTQPVLLCSREVGVSLKKVNVKMVTSKILVKHFKNKENLNMDGIMRIHLILDVVQNKMTL